VADKPIFPGYGVVGDDSVATGGEAPAAGTEGVVEDTAVFDFGEVDDAVSGGGRGYVSINLECRRSAVK